MERDQNPISLWFGWGEAEQDLHATKRDSRPGQGWERAAGKQLLFWRDTHREGSGIAGLGGGMLALRKNNR